MYPRLRSCKRWWLCCIDTRLSLEPRPKLGGRNLEDETWGLKLGGRSKQRPYSAPFVQQSCVELKFTAVGRRRPVSTFVEKDETSCVSRLALPGLEIRVFYRAIVCLRRHKITREGPALMSAKGQLLCLRRQTIAPQKPCTSSAGYLRKRSIKDSKYTLVPAKAATWRFAPQRRSLLPRFFWLTLFWPMPLHRH